MRLTLPLKNNKFAAACSDKSQVKTIHRMNNMNQDFTLTVITYTIRKFNIGLMYAFINCLICALKSCCNKVINEQNKRNVISFQLNISKEFLCFL